MVQLPEDHAEDFPPDDDRGDATDVIRGMALFFGLFGLAILISAEWAYHNGILR